jgi:hypothetical protein
LVDHLYPVLVRPDLVAPTFDHFYKNRHVSALDRAIAVGVDLESPGDTIDYLRLGVCGLSTVF